jgi:A/G-specific adenine glycosylase
MRKTEKIAAVADEIWRWYARHKRRLPWRDLPDTDPTERAYKILVSEIMLQQTQVPRVEVIFPRFLRQFPDLPALAAASNKDVIVAWRGMGYNSRVLRLRDAAKTVQDRFGGVFPNGMDELRSIKGIGAYTAGAVRNFAFGIPTPCIDTNIRRILHRVFIGPEEADGTWPTGDKELLPLAAALLDAALVSPMYKKYVQKLAPGTAACADWHAALMDYGSLVQTKRNPKWEICPLTQEGLCAAAYKVPEPSGKKTPKKEPGRLVGSVFVPNRIFRGRIVEQLRDAHAGLAAREIGARISVDWNPAEHAEWLAGLLEKLEADGMIARSGETYALRV